MAEVSVLILNDSGPNASITVFNGGEERGKLAVADNKGDYKLVTFEPTNEAGKTGPPQIMIQVNSQ